MKVKYLVLWLCLPVLLMIVINELSPLPDIAYQEEACTRYCHDEACLHERQNPLTDRLWAVYEANIRWLKNNPFGLSYQEMNLLVYVISFPLLTTILLWGVLRKSDG